MNETVSIITPSFNRATLVTETAESILAQTYPHWEWMIVDDGSTDNSWEVLQGLAARDNRIKIHKRDRGPKGACVCRNIAVERSTGDYLIFLDTDDILAPFCLEQRRKALQENTASDFVIFPMLMFTKTSHDLNLLWNVDNDVDEVQRILIGDTICQGTGTLWKKKSFIKIGMWREDLHIWQDNELHIRAMLWPLRYTKKMDLSPDVYLRISDDSLSRVGYHTKSKLDSRILVFMEASKKIVSLGLLLPYRSGLRILADNIINGAIRSHYNRDIEALLQYCQTTNIFTREEMRIIRKFQWYYKTRMYKVPYVLTSIPRQFLQITSRSLENSLHKIKWQENNQPMLCLQK